MQNIRRVSRIILLTAAAVILFGFLPDRVTVYAEETAFESTNVMDDLSNATIGDKPFDIREYPYNSADKPRIINFVEYCYSPYANLRGNYGLYLYIYNPQGLEIDTSSPLNKVQIAVSYGTGTGGSVAATDYEKFDLRFCSMSEESDYKRLFYKFKVEDHESADGKTIAERVNSHERRYDVSGFELLTLGEVNANEYTVGGTYKFTGYAKGYGPDETAESLSSAVTDLETVELEIRHASYLSQASDSLYHQLHSVYFSVPQATIERYGEDLQEIKATWYEYKTEMIAVLLPEWANKFQSSVGLLPEEVGISDYMIWDATTSHDVYGRWCFNYGSEQSPLYWLISNSKATESKTYIAAEELLAYMKNYNASFRKGKINGKYSADLFSDGNDGQNHEKIVTIQAEDEYSLLGKEQNSFEKFMNWLTGRPTSYPDLQITRAIEPLKAVDFGRSDAELSAMLFVNEQEIAALREFCEPEIAAGNAPYLFRFAVRDYETASMQTNFRNVVLGWSSDHIGFGARETVFLDFDIIYLKFFRDGQYYTIPVVADPIDGMGGLVSPDDTEPNCRNIASLLLIVLLLLILLRVIILLCKVIGRAIRQRKENKPFREMEKELKDIQKYMDKERKKK